jgi:hypothetical protein
MAEAEFTDNCHGAKAGRREKGVEHVQGLETNLPSSERQQRGSQHDDACAGDHGQRDAPVEHDDRQAGRDERIQVDDRGGYRRPDLLDTDETEQSSSSRTDDPRQHEERNGADAIGVSGFQNQDGAP